MHTTDGRRDTMSFWVRVVAVYHELISIACVAAKELQPGDEVTTSAIDALAGFLPVFTRGPGIDLHELVELYDLEPWKNHRQAFSIVRLITQTAPTDPLSFSILHKIAKWGHDNSDVEVEGAAIKAAADYLAYTSRCEIRRDVLELFDLLIAEWEGDPIVFYREVGHRIRAVFQ
jgi:hypothetical protein